MTNEHKTPVNVCLGRKAYFGRKRSLNVSAPNDMYHLQRVTPKLKRQSEDMLNYLCKKYGGEFVLDIDMQGHIVIKNGEEVTHKIMKAFEGTSIQFAIPMDKEKYEVLRFGWHESRGKGLPPITKADLKSRGRKTFYIIKQEAPSANTPTYLIRHEVPEYSYHQSHQETPVEATPTTITVKEECTTSVNTPRIDIAKLSLGIRNADLNTIDEAVPGDSLEIITLKIKLAEVAELLKRRG